MADRPSIDLTRLSTASKILLGAGLLYFIDLFLSWNRKCFENVGCGTLSGWHGGLGVICGILVIAILAMELITLANIQVNMGTPAMRNMIEAGVTAALLLFTILRVFVKPSVLGISIGVWIWGWIGLILAVVIAYGGYLRWQEARMIPTTPPPPPPGGFTA